MRIQILLAALTMAFAFSLGPGAQAAPAGTTLVASGTFTGASGHETRGSVRILKTPSGYVAELGEDFFLDGAPAPTVGFGQDGFDKTTEFSRLERKRGAQSYPLPASIDPADFNEFYIWCTDFGVPLGVASLAPAAG